MDHLQDYSWQGNVRELSNLVERTSVLLKNQMTLDEILTTLPGEIALADDNGDIQLDKWTRASLLEALTTNKLNISRTARLLNCSRSTLYKKMKELNITITNTDKPVR
jgi:DNA-binding NtrC family response regulator